MVTMASSKTSSCSPPEGRRYKLCTTPARRNPPEGHRYELRTTPARRNPIKMDRGHANWKENTTKTFLDLCIAEKEKLNYNTKGLTKIGWQNLYHNFKRETGRDYDIKQLQNKFNGLKKMFNLWKKLKDKSGGRWDNKTKTIICDAGWWENEIADNNNAKQFRGKPFAYEDELTILFGSMASKDGWILCVDGTGDRALSGGRDDRHARISEDNVGWSVVGCVSQDHVVDSRPTKKTKRLGPRWMDDSDRNDGARDVMLVDENSVLKALDGVAAQLRELDVDQPPLVKAKGLYGVAVKLGELHAALLNQPPPNPGP